MSPKPRLLNTEARTVIAAERVRDIPFAYSQVDPETGEYSVNGYFKGRLIIGRNTRINGGVSIGATSREAIVVDDVKHTELAVAYGLLKNSLFEAQPRKFSILNRILGPKPVTQLTPLAAAEAAYHYTLQLMPVVPEAVSKVSHDRRDKKISLSYFFAVGGVCRQHALLNGYFIEKMIDEGLLYGKVHVERNTAIEGAHTWARFTPIVGESIIMDSTQGFVGTPTQAQEESVFWDYTPTPLSPSA